MKIKIIAIKSKVAFLKIMEVINDERKILLQVNVSNKNLIRGQSMSDKNLKKLKEKSFIKKIWHFYYFGGLHIYQIKNLNLLLSF